MIKLGATLRRDLGLLLLLAVALFAAYQTHKTSGLSPSDFVDAFSARARAATPVADVVSDPDTP